MVEGGIGVSAIEVFFAVEIAVTETASVAELQELNPMASNNKKWQKRRRFPNIVPMSYLRLMNYSGNITRAQNIYPLPKDCFTALGIDELCRTPKQNQSTVRDIPMCLPA